MRAIRLFFVLTFCFAPFLPAIGKPVPPCPPLPNAEQVAWQEDGLAMFLHFGVNTFTNREWGEGDEKEALFNPTELDARQWVRVAQQAGFKLMILTAKHHDGFCLWPSRFTEHSVKNSPWRKGQGDVVKEFSEACREAGMKFGFYLSPWDRHEPKYKDSAAYDQHFKDQLRELLTGYGPVTEVWFDGAGSEGHVYDWAGYYSLIRELQPKALIAICGPDIRWVGNESGVARETEWSVQEATGTSHPDTTGEIWYPAECDVSIRPGWFWHRDQDDKVKSLDHLLDIYYQSVGRNSTLLLNVPPNDKGLLPEPDIARLKEWRGVLDRTFEVDFAQGKQAAARSSWADAGSTSAEMAIDGNFETYWAPQAGSMDSWLEIDLGEPTTFDVVRTEEFIPLGQRVSKYRIEAEIEGTWKTLVEGTTIGHCKLDRIEPVTAHKVRLVIEEARCNPPLIRRIGLHKRPD